MSESEIIKVYQEGIQSVISLVQGLSTQISELSQTVSDLDARLKKLEKQSNQISHPNAADFPDCRQASSRNHQNQCRE